MSTVPFMMANVVLTGAGPVIPGNALLLTASG
jgi:hypothetical protein